MMQKHTFTIKDEFYLDGHPFQIISGGIHYFRMVPQYWRDRLHKLKLLGCNTVETYVPWNLHEPKKGVYDFTGRCDLERFLQLIQESGLYAIVRPSPYICAEWEFGGLPGWLMAEDKMHVRTAADPYISHVSEYYKELMRHLVPYQITNGGPIIMMQIENEYGYYSDDASYPECLKNLMTANGVNVPLVTSDGPWGDALACGSMKGILPTANFGSQTDVQFPVLQKYTNGGPLMCMEFWVGWFDAWGDKEHHTTKIERQLKDLSDILQQGSVNIYMFCGGTNFGFMNGSNYYDHLMPDVTSYDYDALLTEDGRITPKYLAFQKVIQKYTGKKDSGLVEAGQVMGESQLREGTQVIEQSQLRKRTQGMEQSQLGEGTQMMEQCSLIGVTQLIERKAYGTLPCVNKVSLWNTLSSLALPVRMKHPACMEKMGQSYGYHLYRTTLNKESKLEKVQMFKANDRASIFLDQKPVVTLYDKELLSEYQLTESVDCHNAVMDILVENMGRVNFGSRMDEQRKGIDGCVTVNGHQHTNWEQYVLEFEHLDQLDFGAGYVSGQPAFYEFVLNIHESDYDTEYPPDTFLELDGWGKGCVVVNGFCLGRFWEAGPQKRLYLPGPVLRQGRNQIIVFETEGKAGASISLWEEPDLG